MTQKYIVTNFEVEETPQEVVLMIDLPGLDERSLSVSVDEGSIRLSGKLDLGESSKPRFRECEMGLFSRLFRIAPDVTPDRFRAQLEDGMLRMIFRMEAGTTPAPIQPQPNPEQTR
ncbi:MAG: Hsp20/alpha crystallin family protein [Planctomycetota bacterium]|jgi:HSP20 family protein